MWSYVFSSVVYRRNNFKEEIETALRDKGESIARSWHLNSATSAQRIFADTPATVCFVRHLKEQTVGQYRFDLQTRIRFFRCMD